MIENPHKNYPYFYKVQLHCHSHPPDSDNQNVPDVLFKRYQAAGYAATMLTEHKFKYQTGSYWNGIDNLFYPYMLLWKGYEDNDWNGSFHHLHVGEKETLTVQDATAPIRFPIFVMAHPNGNETAEEKLRGETEWWGMEFFGDTSLWNEIIATRINRGWKLIKGVMTDDAHHMEEVDKRWILINSALGPKNDYLCDRPSMNPNDPASVSAYATVMMKRTNLYNDLLQELVKGNFLAVQRKSEGDEAIGLNLEVQQDSSGGFRVTATARTRCEMFITIGHLDGSCDEFPMTSAGGFSFYRVLQLYQGDIWCRVRVEQQCYTLYSQVINLGSDAIRFHLAIYKALIVSQNVDGRLEVFYTGVDDVLYNNAQTRPNGNWRGELALGGWAKQIVARQNADGRLEVFYIGTNNQLYHNAQIRPSGNWGSEAALGGAAKQIVAGLNADGRLEVFYIGTDDQLYHNAQTRPNGNWRGELALGGWAKQIAIGQNADGRLELFYVGTNNKLYYNAQTQPNGDWGSEAALGGAAKQIATGRNADGRLEVFYIGTDDQLYHNWQTQPNGSWRGEEALGGAAKQIVVGRNADGRLEVFYIGTNDQLYHNAQTRPNGNWGGEAGL